MANTTLFEDLKSKKLISVKDYRLRLMQDIDLSMYGSKAWAYTLQTIGLKKGSDFLYDKGYTMGKVSAELIEEKKEDIPQEFQGTENYIMMCGFGDVTILSLNNEKRVDVKKNQTITFAKELYGKESLVCEFYRGIYNAFIDVFEGKTILTESSCICKGNIKCSFKGDQ